MYNQKYTAKSNFLACPFYQGSMIDVMVDSPSKNQKTARYRLPPSGN